MHDRTGELREESAQLFEIHRIVSERLELCVRAMSDHNAYRQELAAQELRETARTLAETVAERYPAGGRN